MDSTEETRHLRETLQAALKEIEALKEELAELRQRREVAVDIYDLDVLKEDVKACPWTGWSTR